LLAQFWTVYVKPKRITSGWSSEEIDLARARFCTSGVPAKVSSDFDQVNAQLAWKPCEKRLSAVNCNELYQLSPSGGFTSAIVVNCGYGRSDWATEAVRGKPGKGSLFWKRPAAAEPIGASRVARSAWLFRLRPFAARMLFDR